MYEFCTGTSAAIIISTFHITNRYATGIYRYTHIDCTSTSIYGTSTTVTPRIVDKVKAYRQ